MALTIAQYEELLGVIREVPSLVDKLEERQASFPDELLSWLKHAERVLTNYRLPDASQIAAYRARLIEASRGVQQGNITIVGRLSLRKIREATGALMLDSGNNILQGVIAERKSVFQEAERISRQMVAVAQVKGLVNPPGPGDSHQRFLHQLRDHIAADPDLGTVHTHVVGLVGASDALIMMDRALASVGDSNRQDVGTPPFTQSKPS